MSPHKKIYFDHYGYTEGDWIKCELPECNKTAVDVHAIECDGMGGRPSKSTHVITNLIALCREHHIELGDKKQHKERLMRVHIFNLSKLI